MSKVNELFSLQGKVAIVTGSGRGLGQAMAVGLAQAGGVVALCGRKGNELEDTKKKIQQTGGHAEIYLVDVANENEVDGVVEKIGKDFGHLDILINNAGIGPGHRLVEHETSLWNKVIAVNLTGVFFFGRAVARHMTKQKSGKIVNIASELGLLGGDYMSAYCAAKGGVIQLTKVWAIELGQHGIRVNAIAPGLFRTQMTEESFKDQGWLAKYVERTALKKYGKPEDIVGLVVFLSAQASDHITGQTILIDAGYTINAS